MYAVYLYASVYVLIIDTPHTTHCSIHNTQHPTHTRFSHTHTHTHRELSCGCQARAWLAANGSPKAMDTDCRLNGCFGQEVTSRLCDTRPQPGLSLPEAVTWDPRRWSPDFWNPVVGESPWAHHFFLAQQAPVRDKLLDAKLFFFLKRPWIPETHPMLFFLAVLIIFLDTQNSVSQRHDCRDQPAPGVGLGGLFGGATACHEARRPCAGEGQICERQKFAGAPRGQGFFISLDMSFLFSWVVSFRKIHKLTFHASNSNFSNWTFWHSHKSLHSIGGCCWGECSIPNNKPPQQEWYSEFYILTPPANHDPWLTRGSHPTITRKQNHIETNQSQQKRQT